jgi:LysR family transcriptional regulator, regulator of abg operon
MRKADRISMSMTIQQLRDFVAVVHHGSLRAAARSLEASQPGLTRSIQSLEQSLQASLLVRSTRGIRLTPAGHELFGRARLLLRDFERAEAAVTHLGQTEEGSISFGLSTAPLLALFPKVVGQFRSRRPKVKLHFSTGLASTLLPAIREGRLDFAVMPVRDPQDLAGLQATRIGDSAPVVVARRGHPAARARSIRDLRNCEWLLVTPGPEPSRQGNSVTDLFEAHGLGPPRALVSTDSILNCVPLLAATDLLAALPPMAVEDKLLGDRLVRIPIAETLPSYGIYLVYRAETPLHGHAAELASMFISLSRLGALPQPG